MGNLNNTFFDALDAAATWSAGVAFKRSKGLPLDKYSVFESKDLAIEYAEKRGAYAETPVSYPGQVIAVQEGTKMVAYVLNENADSTKLELQQIGIIPTGDGKTIDVTEDGVISLLAADVQVDEKNEDGEATGNKVINAGAQLVLQADGTIKWVQPDTSTAEGQAAAISGLKTRVDAIEPIVVKPIEGAEPKPEENLWDALDAEAKARADADKALGERIDGVNTALADYTKTTDMEAELAKKADKSAYDQTVIDLDALEAKVNAFFEGTGVENVIDTLEDLINYINSHDDVEISDILGDIQSLENKLTLGTYVDGEETKEYATVKAYVEAAIAALKIGDYAKAADLTELAGKVTTLESKVDVDKVSEAIATAKSGAETTAQGYANTAEQNAKNYADTELAKKADADKFVSNDAFNSFKEENTGVINGVSERVEDIEDKLDTIEENAEVNTIKTVKVEGSALTPDSERAVNITRDGLNVYSKDEVNSKVQEATSAANTNTANIDELEKVLYGRVITKDEQYPEQSTVSDGMIAKVANNAARIAAAEGKIDANTTEIAKNTAAASAAQARADEAYALAGTKANQTYVETELGKKADKSELTEAVNGINASIGETNAEVAKKAVKTEVDAALDLKADKSTTYTKTEIDGKVAEINTEVAKKAVKTEVKAALDLKADKSTTYTKTDVDGFVALLATKEELSDVNETAEQGVADAAAAKGVADEALGKIDAFMDTTAASDDVVNTLKEIIELINSEDAELSEALLGEINGLKAKFDENGKALNADKLDGLDSTAFATAEQGTKADNAAAAIATYGDIVTHKVEEFATAAQGTKADNAAAAIATYGDIVTHNANEFATAAQGGKADTAIQAVAAGTGLKATVDTTDVTKVTIDIDEAVTFILRGGSATGFATVTENN